MSHELTVAHPVSISDNDVSVSIDPSEITNNGRNIKLRLKSDAGEFPISIFYNPVTEHPSYKDRQQAAAYDSMKTRFTAGADKQKYSVKITVEPPENHEFPFDVFAAARILREWRFSFIKTEFDGYGHGPINIVGYRGKDMTNGAFTNILLMQRRDSASKPLGTPLGMKRQS